MHCCLCFFNAFFQADLAGLLGIGSVPPKLIKRIVAREYIDIWELLPETWQVETAEGACCHSKRPRWSLVTDINVWTECYATLAAILSSTYPDKAPHFFTYLHTITKASRTFESCVWATYDMAFHRQAANRGSLDRGIVDAALYSEAFAGRAKVFPCCRYCLTDTHASPECPYTPADTSTENRHRGDCHAVDGPPPKLVPRNVRGSRNWSPTATHGPPPEICTSSKRTRVSVIAILASLSVTEPCYNVFSDGDCYVFSPFHFAAAFTSSATLVTLLRTMFCAL